MNDSEKILSIITEISIEKNINLFDAMILFAEDKLIDIEDIVQVLDDNVIDKLKQDALDSNIVYNRKLFETHQVTSLF